MSASPIDATVAHAVPLLLRGTRGGRVSFGEDVAHLTASIPGVEPEAFAKATIHNGMYDREVLRLDGRNWLPVEHAPETGPTPGRLRPMPLDLALAALARGWRERHADPDDTTDGLAGPPLAAVVNPSLRYTPSGIGLPSKVPPEAYEAGLATARRAVLDHVANGMRHDGRHLYRAIDVPLIYPHVMPGTNSNIWSCLREPGILPHRIGEDGRFPHAPRGEGDQVYVGNVREIRRNLALSVRDVDHGDADIVEFANEIPPGLVVLLRTLGSGEPGLRRLADDLWPLVAEGSVRGIRGDALLPAVETIRSAAAAMNATPRRGRTPAILGSILAFADRVALPALRERTPLPEADAESLGALTF